jgi:glutaredoxin
MMTKASTDTLPTHSDGSEPCTQKTNDEAKVTVISDLDVYEGDNLEEKIESLIESHPVVMFNRTWCLFSVDAQNFLVGQLNVPVHSVEIDTHPQGKEIMKCVSNLTNHETTPIIFIRGDFLGGFEEVNSLYSQGKLQEEYLQGLSQADKCEAFLVKKNLQATPYFWFPEKVDGNVVRISGVLTFFVSALSAILVHWELFFWSRYLAYGIAIDFILRLLGGAPFSLIGRIAMLITRPLDPNPRMGRPKQFATMLGVVFSTLGSIFYLVTFPYSDIVGSVFMGGLAYATFLEGFLDFCIGCTMFQLGVKMKLFQN